MRNLEKALDRVDWLFARVTAVAILLVMFIIMADVIGRYAFNSPIPWVYDVISIYFINLVLYFMASENLRTRSHIALDMHFGAGAARLVGLLQVLAWIGVTVVLVLAAFMVGRASLASLAAHDVHPGLYEWPVWVEKGIVALGLVLLVCRIALRLARVCLRQDDASLLDRDETAGEAP